MTVNGPGPNATPAEVCASMVARCKEISGDFYRDATASDLERGFYTALEFGLTLWQARDFMTETWDVANLDNDAKENLFRNYP